MSRSFNSKPKSTGASTEDLKSSFLPKSSLSDDDEDKFQALTTDMCSLSMVNKKADLSSVANQMVEDDRVERAARNLFALISSTLRLQMSKTKNGDPKLVKLLELLNIISVDPSMAPLLDPYLEEDMLKEAFSSASQLLQSSSVNHFEQFRQNLFSSLVGTQEEKYTLEKMDQAVEWLDYVGVKYARGQALLKLKSEELHAMKEQLLLTLKEAVDPDMLASAKAITQEKVTTIKLQEIQIKLLEHELKEERKEYGEKSTTTNTTTKSSSDVRSYAELVLENESLEQRLQQLKATKATIARLDQTKVARLRYLSQELEFINKMNNQEDSRSIPTSTPLPTAYSRSTSNLRGHHKLGFRSTSFRNNPRK